MAGVATDRHAARFHIGIAHKKHFEELYDLGNNIQRGSFAVVKECFHREWQEKYAVKIIKRDGRTDEAVLHEVAIMNQLDNPHIVKVVDFLEDKDFYYIVMELMNGGDVFDRIISMNHYTEADARDLTKILLETVSYMHECGIAHRDLKPQNLLLEVRICELCALFRRLYSPCKLAICRRKRITPPLKSPISVLPERSTPQNR
jgi:serine/threonine protein kinase